MICHGLRDKTAKSVRESLLNYLADTAQLGVVTTLLSDRGKEYMDEATSALFRDRRIEHRTSAAYWHDGNPYAERIWRTLLGNTRAMLHHARLPKKHWHAALQHAVYTYNRTPRLMNRSGKPAEKGRLSTPYFEATGVTPTPSEGPKREHACSSTFSYYEPFACYAPFGCGGGQLMSLRHSSVAPMRFADKATMLCKAAVSSWL